MSQRKNFVNAVIYGAATIVGVLCLPLPIYALFGASSLFQSILFLVAMGERTIAYLILAYIILFLLLLAIGCILAYRKKRTLFVVTVCVDLAVSILFCLYNALSGRVISANLTYDLMGIIPHVLFCGYVLMTKTDG